MYAPREPNVRPAIQQDPGRIRHPTPNVDIGIPTASELPASPPSDQLPESGQPDIPPQGRSDVTRDSSLTPEKTRSFAVVHKTA